MENIDFTKLSGDWYMHRSTEFLKPELTPSCHKASMKIEKDGNFISREFA